MQRRDLVFDCRPNCATRSLDLENGASRAHPSRGVDVSWQLN